MTLFSSLSGRIFLASALLAVLSIGVALYLVDVRVGREGEGALQREISATAALVDQLRATRTQTFMTTARLIADIPQLKAAVDTNDPPTVRDIAGRYQQQLGSQLGSRLLLVTNKTGQVLSTIGAIAGTLDLVPVQPAIQRALGGGESVILLPEADGILQLVTVPMLIGRDPQEILGALSVGFMMDDGLAAELKAVTGSEIAFGMGGRILASTLPLPKREALIPLLGSTTASRATLDADDYVVSRRPLAAAAGSDDGLGPTALILRSRTEQLRFLDALRTGLVATAIFAVALAVLLSFAVARTITRPLAAITDAMRQMASTGQLTYQIAVPQRRWDDEDARVLASTFSALTRSVARFQREESQRERLASLGRLSTVIAHEIRNPLMIIKAALHGLRGSAEPAVVDAAADINEEVTRLNRLVNDVLDFTRPIAFELAPTDLNALCVDSARAADGAGSDAPIAMHLDPSLQPMHSDPERLRLALVNILLNARDAVAAVGARGSVEDRGPGLPGASDVELRARGTPAADGTPTEQGNPRAPVTLTTTLRGDRAVITVADHGVGIPPEDLARIFEPYFTTKRGGTGLGLAIAKNVVEGLGGTIEVSSAPGRGTEIRLDLPAV